MPSEALRTAIGSPCRVVRRTYPVCAPERMGRASSMRILVTGATGNVGTSVVNVLASDARVTEIVGLARRLPWLQVPRTRWVAADIVDAPLTELFRGADVVIHLAWLIQPSRDAAQLEAVNVLGTRRVFEAAAAAGVGALVYASSVGAYSPAPASGERVDESWPTDGI